MHSLMSGLEQHRLGSDATAAWHHETQGMGCSTTEWTAIHSGGRARVRTFSSVPLFLPSAWRRRINERITDQELG
jgi:hypothetical protein